MLKTIRNNAVVVLVCTLWKYANGYRVHVIVYTVLAVIAIVIDLLIPAAQAGLMNAVQYEQGDALMESAFWYLSLIVIMEVSFWLFHGPSRVLENVTAAKVRRSMQNALFGKLIELPLSWHRNHHSGETIDQVKEACSSMNHVCASGFEVLHIVTKVLGAVCVLSYFHWSAGLAVCLSGFAAMYTIVKIDKGLIKLWEECNKAQNKVAASVQDYLTNVTSIISLRIGSRVSKEVDHRAEDVVAITYQSAKTNELKWFTSSLFVIFTQVGVMLGCLGIYVARGEVIAFGTAYALWRYLSIVGDSFFQFTYKYGELVANCTKIRAVEHIDRAHQQLVKPVDTSLPPKRWQEVAIERIHFEFEKAKNDHSQLKGIRDLSLRFTKGKSYALVGSSGGGKSTLLGLLRGIHPAFESSVSFPCQRMMGNLAQIGNVSTLVPQEPELFAKSIRFNICLGLEVPEAMLEKAIELAFLDDVIQSLPEGLKTNISEKGVNLSGGQKQRLALARGLLFAIYSQSSIILLDEPTSSVDPQRQRLIYKGIIEHFNDKLVIAVTHNVNTLDLFDELLVIESGKLQRSGSYSELSLDSEYFLGLLDDFDYEPPKVFAAKESR